VATLSEITQLPSGLSFQVNGAGTALLYGAPATAGKYAITISADNGVSPIAAQTMTLTVNQPKAPAVARVKAATFTAGKPGDVSFSAGGTPIPTLIETGNLPAGLSFTPYANGTATLSGTPALGVSGAYHLTIGATNEVGSAPAQAFTLTVDQAPTIISANTATFTTGMFGSFGIVIGDGAFPAVTITRRGTLPAGVSLVTSGSGSPALRGTPAAGTGRTYNLTLTAANGVAPAATQAFTLIVLQPPKITSHDSATFKLDKNGSFTVKTSGLGPLTAGLSDNFANLPAGLTFTDNDNGTATLAGDAQPGTRGTYVMTLTADNGVLPDFNQTFTLIVD
jgi:hypothetical protein